ncbi:MAG: LAGLIDADG family homing endonuclease [Nanoarchaeota archaeon]|nr:LAGLIDADG family homing endonuclease [Nanoarchaeota archaeon]
MSLYSLHIQKYGKDKKNICISPSFSLALHYKDKDTLEKLKKFMGVGNIIKNPAGHFLYQITSINDLLKIIKVFDRENYFFVKKNDYICWRDSVFMLKDGEHRDYNGLFKILKNREELNKLTQSKRRIGLKDIEKMIGGNYKKRVYTHCSSNVDKAKKQFELKVFLKNKEILPSSHGLKWEFYNHETLNNFLDLYKRVYPKLKFKIVERGL